LKKGILVLNQTFNELRPEQHPDKTLIGRAERGSDFLGDQFEREELSVAVITIERFKERITRLYEQEPLNKIEKRLGEYLLR
jgi:hypothetical protein